MVKASIVVMSHLSDAQMCSGPENRTHINFAKYVINKTDGDLNTDIDPDALWQEYCDYYSINVK